MKQKIYAASCLYGAYYNFFHGGLEAELREGWVLIFIKDDPVKEYVFAILQKTQP